MIVDDCNRKVFVGSWFARREYLELCAKFSTLAGLSIACLLVRPKVDSCLRLRWNSADLSVLFVTGLVWPTVFGLAVGTERRQAPLDFNSWTLRRG